MRPRPCSIPLLTACVFSLILCASTLSPISIYGSKFYDNGGNQFFIKGVAYQYGSDPLTNPDQCQTDAEMLQKLGANAIRVYTVDRNTSHDDCMTVFAVAGIYVIVDLSTATESISRTSPNWTMDLYNSYTSSFASFAKYDNLLAVFVGNEVVSQANNTPAAAFVKAAARDVKAFRDASGYRSIPVGYATADVEELRTVLYDYMACGSDPADAVDFYAFNVYSWCGFATYVSSGYNLLNEVVGKSQIPVFLSETGCNDGSTRNFGDQAELLGPDMSSTWSGSVVYEYFEEQNNYGLVQYTNNLSQADPDVSPSGSPTPISPAFDFLQERWSTLTPSSTAASDYTPTNQAPACPSSTASTWLIDAAQPLPTIPGLTISTISRVTTVKSATFAVTSTSKAASGTGKKAPSTSSSASPAAPSSKNGSRIHIVIIVICVILFILLILAASFVILLHKKRKANALDAANRHEGKTELGGAPISQLDAAGNQITPHREELEDTAKTFAAVELPAEPVKQLERPMNG